MEIQRCTSASFLRPFQVLEPGGTMPGTKESEDITCPHHSYIIQRTSNCWFRTIPLLLKKEEDFNADNSL